MSRAYDAIAARLLSMTDEAGNWTPCWHKRGLTMPTNHLTKRAYRGANILSLWVDAQMRGYEINQWATFKQWLEVGQVVRKGEHGTPIVFWGQHTPDGENAKTYSFARGSTVFNIAQVDPLEGKSSIMPKVEDLPDNPDARIAGCEAFAAGTGATIRHFDRAVAPCFIPSLDQVHMPDYGRFHHAAGYYGVLFHELTHWTGAKHRLAREMSMERSKYALEELVAELGAAFICADLGIEAEPRPDHASYLKHWHAVLKQDVPAFMKAVSQAARAAAYLHELQLDRQEAA